MILIDYSKIIINFMGTLYIKFKFLTIPKYIPLNQPKEHKEILHIISEFS